MKGFFFAKPLEFHLETPAEETRQGETIGGTLSAMNRGVAPESGVSLKVALAYGVFKDLKLDSSGFEILKEKTLKKQISLESGARDNEKFELNLPPGCPITTKVSSLFLLYGSDLKEKGKFGVIDLRVFAAPALETLVKTAENHFSFEARTWKNTQEGILVTFKPPASLKTMEELTLEMKVDESKALHLVYSAKFTTLSRQPGKGVSSRRENLEQTHQAEKYLSPGGNPDRTYLKQAFAEALETLKPPLIS